MGASQSSGGRTQQYPLSTESKSAPQKSTSNSKNSFTKNQLSRLLSSKKNVQQVAGSKPNNRSSNFSASTNLDLNDNEYEGDSNRSPMSSKYLVPAAHSQNIDSANGNLLKPTINLADTYNELEVGAASPSTTTTAAANGYNIINNNNNNHNINNSELLSSVGKLRHKSGGTGDHFVNQQHQYQFQQPHQVQAFQATHQQAVRGNDNRYIMRGPPSGSNPLKTIHQAPSKQLVRQQQQLQQQPQQEHQHQQQHFNCSNSTPGSKQTSKSDKHKAPQMKSSCSPSSASAASSSSPSSSSSSASPSSTSIEEAVAANHSTKQQNTPTPTAALGQRHQQQQQQLSRVVHLARIVSTQTKQANNIVAPSGLSGHDQHVSGVDNGTGDTRSVEPAAQWKLNSSGASEQRGQYNYATAAMMKQAAYGNSNRLALSGQQQQQSHLQAPLKPLVVATQQQYPVGGAHTNGVRAGGRQHQRAHSSGGVMDGSLSWSKNQPQQKQETNVLYNNNNINLSAADSLEYQQFASNFQHHSNQFAAPTSARTSGLQTADEIEQFYSRNLHLLTDQHHQDQAEDNGDDDGLDPYNSLLLLNEQQHLQQQLAGQHSLSSYSTGTTPRQRRYKWPKQQYQYFNNNSNSGQFDHQTSGATPLNANQLRVHYGNKQQLVGAGGTLAPINADYATNLLLLSDNNSQQQPSQLGNDPLIYYNNLNHYNTDELDQRDHVYSSGNPVLDGSYVIPPPPHMQLGAPSNSHKLVNKSATLSMSSAAASKPKKSRNPLAAIFPFTNSSSSSSNYNDNSSAHHNRANNNNNNNSYSNSNSNQAASFKQQYNSNTIHLSSSKSHQNLLLQSGGNNRLTSSSGLAGGSLKRIKSSPLTAQQTSYEAMRTIDMYLIRQIARSCMDFEMEQKIDLEIRLRELASQSLLEARNEIDVLEVEKSLLTSDQRMNCYASQLEQQRKQLSNVSLSTDSGRASKTSCQQQRRRDGSQARQTTGDTGGQQRSDVIGAALANGSSQTRPDNGGGQRGDNSYASEGTDSPSFSSMSKSSQSSPSKLSPVSGESANSPAGAKMAQSSSSAASSCHRSRRSNNAVRQQSSGANTLNNRRQRLNSSGGGGVGGAKSSKSKQRERLKQTITRQSNIDCNMVVDNRATLTISELRIPLMWRDVDHFKGRGDYRRYAVFCLLKIDSQIYDTQLISDVDRQMTDLTFDDVIIFNNIDHEYELTLEVYSCVYLEQFSFSSTPRKLKEKLSNSVSRAMGRRLATHTASANYTKELEAYDKSYRFAMIASAKLGLVDASDSIKTYDLHLVSPEAHGRQSTLSRQHHHPSSSDTMTANNNPYHYYNSNLGGGGYCGIVTASNQKDLHKNTLPLFGHFCCNLQVRPDVFDKCVKSGYLRIAPIDLPNLVVKQQNTSDELTSSACRDNNQRTKSSHSKSRSDSPAEDSGKSSLSNDDLNTTSSNDCSMLRSALAASSKLAAISMSNSTVHWALLRNFTLHLWHIDEHKLEMAMRRGHAPQVDISGKQPFCISIDRHTRLLRVSNSSLTIETDKGCFVIAVHNVNEQINSNSHDEIGQWLRPIEQMIYDSHIWSSVLNRHLPSLRSKHPKQ